MSSNRRVSGELSISQYRVVRHLHSLGKIIRQCLIVPLVNKILQNFDSPKCIYIYIYILGFMYTYCKIFDSPKYIYIERNIHKYIYIYIYIYIYRRGSFLYLSFLVWLLYFFFCFCFFFFFSFLHIFLLFVPQCFYRPDCQSCQIITHHALDSLGRSLGRVGDCAARDNMAAMTSNDFKLAGK